MRVVLFGNGINRLNSNNSWEELLNELAKSMVEKPPLSMKPFPLYYEEIILTLKMAKKDEEKLISYLFNKIDNKMPDDLYKEFCQYFDVILTTNYDYNIERAISKSPLVKENIKTITKESKFSLFRYDEIDGKKVWHIHGEINKPNSICLGYERYGGNIERTRGFIINGDHKKGINPLKTRLPLKKYESWIDYFFQNDIYIIGLGMGFEEIDLWWLLDYRAREINNSNKKITNKIYYYYPYIDTNFDDKTKMEKQEESIAQVLTSFGVIVKKIHIIAGKYSHFYQEVLKKIKTKDKQSSIEIE
jgi:hypothetical protein